MLRTEISNDTEKKGGSPMYQLLGQLLSNEINTVLCLATTKLKILENKNLGLSNELIKVELPP